MKRLLILLLTCACYILQAQVPFIKTIAGTGDIAFGGDDSVATYAKLNTPYRASLDKWNNLYVVDAMNNRIRKIDAVTNIITTVAGDGSQTYGGDNGPATLAKLNIPQAVITDTAGNIYIADGRNNRIRKITIATGIITTIGGNGAMTYGGDNGPATHASLIYPSGLSFDASGNLYIADWGNARVRKIDATTSVITTIAGNGSSGYTGDNGSATDASVGAVQVFVDNAGNVLIADQGNHAVRKVNVATGIITTVAGNGTAGYSGDNAPATDAQLNMPCGLFVDAHNNIFIAEYDNGTIRKVDGATGIITTVAGTGIVDFSGDGGPATNAGLACSDVILDKNGDMIIADDGNRRIRKISSFLAAPSVPVKGSVVVYPNPAHDKIIIENAVNGTVNIYTMTGQMMLTKKIKTSKEQVDTKGLVSGVYAVEVIRSDGSKECVQVVKE